MYSVSEHSRSTHVGLLYSIHVIIHFRSDRYILDRNQIEVLNVLCLGLAGDPEAQALHRLFVTLLRVPWEVNHVYRR